jgi:hypothetical protein
LHLCTATRWKRRRLDEVRERGDHARLNTERRDEPDAGDGRAYAAPRVTECERRDEVLARRERVQERERKSERPKKGGSSHQACG